MSAFLSRYTTSVPSFHPSKVGASFVSHRILSLKVARYSSLTCSRVASSHSRIPKAYTSAFSLLLASLITCTGQQQHQQQDELLSRGG